MTTAATNPLTYNGYISQVATMAIVNTQTTSSVVQGVDAAFNAIVPMMLDYAELRIQRDLDLLPLKTSRTYATTVNTNMLTISVNDFVVLESFEITGSSGTTPLLPVTKEYLQNIYGGSSTTGTPAYFAMYGGDLGTAGNTSNIIMFGPYADSAYPVTITGMIRAPSLYQFANPSQAGTGTTFISTNYPDLLLMASMVYISAYQRNFGRQSDDPAMAQSYEGQYQVLLRGSIGEEYRKRFQASAWTSLSSSPPATPTR